MKTYCNISHAIFAFNATFQPTVMESRLPRLFVNKMNASSSTTTIPGKLFGSCENTEWEVLTTNKHGTLILRKSKKRELSNVFAQN